MVTITESAREYLKELLDKQSDALGVEFSLITLALPVRKHVCLLS